MIAIRRKLHALFADRRGATAIEYGLICALIVVAMMGALGGLGGGVAGAWNNMMTTVSTNLP